MNNKTILTNENFFDQLAYEFDQMISFQKAVENKKRILANYIVPGMKYAADLGCGSGADSIALASAGLKVAAFDPSDEMLKAAKENVKKKKVKVSFHKYSIDEIPDEFNDQFDIAVSLGNTFANIKEEKFNESILKCYKILKRSGILLIQILNYKKILSEKERVVNITESSENYYIRFYDFINGEIIFNILTFSQKIPSDYKLISTKIYPHSSESFLIGLQKSGFKSIQFYSDLSLSDFRKEESKGLIIKAVK